MTWRRKNLESFEEWELRVSQQPPFSAGSTNIDLKRMPRYNLDLKLKGKKNAQSELRRTFLETQLNKESWTGPNFILSKVYKLKLC